MSMDIGTPVLLSRHAPERRKGERREPAAMEPVLFSTEMAILGVLGLFTLYFAIYFLTGYISGLFS